ncbi:MAG: DMT family transporter [Lachnospiraceae bacterium]|nr:DMT family transporter [Lachnospiraceae bacterium]
MKAKMQNITAMLIFGSIGLFVRNIRLSSSEIALVRGMIGTGVLLAAMGIMKCRISREALKRNFWLLLFSGGAIGANWICLFEAYRYTTISTATLCYYLAPVFVVAVSPFLLKERLTKGKAASILLSLLGMVLVADVFGSHGAGPENTRGILFGISAAVLYASVIVTNKFLKNITSMESTAAQLGIASAVLLPYVVLTEELGVFSVDIKTGILLLVVGILHTGFAYLIYFSSIRHLRGQTVALFSYIDPITAIILSAVLMKEEMTILQVIGAMLILGSTLAAELLPAGTLKAVAEG